MAAVAAVGAVSIFDVIGVFSATIGLIGFLENNFPKLTAPTNMDSFVRIGIAMNGVGGEYDKLYHAAGTAPLIHAFNEAKDHIGSSQDEEYIESGSFRDITIWQERLGPGDQATWLQIISTANELCIAYIGQKWADGTIRGWIGDTGKGCGRDWYFSNIIVGRDHKPSESSEASPSGNYPQRPNIDQSHSLHLARPRP